MLTPKFVRKSPEIIFKFSKPTLPVVDTKRLVPPNIFTFNVPFIRKVTVFDTFIPKPAVVFPPGSFDNPLPKYKFQLGPVP